MKEDLLELMQIPSLRPERARALHAADITTIERVTEVRDVQHLVSVFMKGDGFVSHRRSNAEELQFKYEYLYTLASKVMSEAQQIRLKQKYDPDATVINYLALQQDHRFLDGTDYMLLSD